MTEKEFAELDRFGSLGIGNLLSPIAPKVEGTSLTGYHALSTTTFRANHPGVEFRLDETDIAMAEMSARFWKRFNGPIKMLTDRTGYAYLADTPLKDAYDEILPVLDDRNCGISPLKYWAAAKIRALSRVPLPCAILDMDMLILKPLDLSGERLVGACYEFVEEVVYPPFSFFSTRPGYAFPPEWSEEALPVNTAFLYIGDEELRDYYTRESYRFMLAEKESPDYWATCMVFAEQRILGMCAEARGIYSRVLNSPDGDQGILTHFWNIKGKIRNDQEIRAYFMELSEKILRQLREA